MKQIIDLLNQHNKQIKNKPILLSVSGGVDSMVLLHLLIKNDFDVHVLHFNHQKREKSHEEAKLVQSYCEEHHVSFHYILLDFNSSGNFHDQAHKLRKYHLLQTAKEIKSKHIVTAHHADDLLESILIKMTRGSNLLGYAGMQYSYQKNGITYLKPLLYTSKKEIIQYATKHKVPYMEDESNDGNSYLRNRYRHAITPIMKQENPQLLEQIKQYHMQITHAFKYIRKQAISYISNDTINLDVYKNLDETIQNEIIAYLLENQQIEFNFDKLHAIKLMLLNDTPNQTYDLNHKYVFIKAYNKATIEVDSQIKQAFIEVKNNVSLPKNMKIFTFLDETTHNTEEFIKLCYNKLAFPLWLRHRLDGDKLAYTYGHKKLKKLLIDQKVPIKKRDSLWVLTDNNNQILWVENYYLNETLGHNKTLYIKPKGD